MFYRMLITAIVMTTFALSSGANAATFKLDFWYQNTGVDSDIVGSITYTAASNVVKPKHNYLKGVQS